MDNIIDKTMVGVSASKVILQNYIEDNLVSTEKDFALLVLQYSHNPNLIVENIEAFKPYKEFVEMKLNEINVNKTSQNLPSRLDCTRFFKKGNISENTKNRIVSDTRFAKTKGSTTFILGDKLNDFVNNNSNTAEILDHKFFEFQSGVYGEKGLIYRRLMRLNSGEESYLLMTDSRFYAKSTKVVTDILLLVDGNVNYPHYIARLDSVGFMEEKFLNEHNIEVDIPTDIEKEARQTYKHKNTFNKNNNLTNAIKDVDSNIHMHILDEDFELARAAMEVYSDLLPQDCFSKGREFQTKMNALPYDHYHYTTETVEERFANINLKLEHATKLKGIIPFKQIINRLDETLNVTNSHEFQLEEYTYEFIDRSRDPKADIVMTPQSIETAEKYAKIRDQLSL